MADNWDFGYTPYENTKQNLISLRSSQNRFGAKFKDIYNKHKSLNGEYSSYNFTGGFRDLFSQEDAQEEKDKVTALLTSIDDIFGVSLTGTDYTINDSVESSFIAAQYLEDSQAETFGVTYQITLSAALPASGTDARRKSTYLKVHTLLGTKPVGLDVLEAQTDTFGLRLFAQDGTRSGHYDVPMLPALEFQALESTFTVDDSTGLNGDNNFIFHQDIATRFDTVKVDFERYLSEYILSTQYYHDNTVGMAGSDVIVLSLGQFRDYLHDSIQEQEDFINHTSDARSSDDLELVELLQISKSLKDSIDKPHKIKSLKFVFSQQFTMPDSENWWEAVELKKMAPMGILKEQIEKHCEVIVVVEDMDNAEDIPVLAGEKFTIRAKDSFLTLPNWQICLFVQHFLDIDVSVKKKWYQTGVFKLLTAIVTVALIILTENPVWAKVLLASTAVASQYGLIGPEAQMLVSAAMMVYGVVSVDLSAMSGTEMFNFAVKNINMTANIVNLQQQVSLESQAQSRQKEIDAYYASQKQDQVTQYIYTSSYDEYSTFYDALYKY